MKQNNIVSVIIPTYNSSEFIYETIESVLNQTYQNLEVIVVDDCSIDNTEGIIKSLQQKDKRIIFYKLEKNSGAAIARNKGISLANGRYIAFLDSDDLWDYEKINKQINSLQENSSCFCFTAYSLIDCKGNQLKGKINVNKAIITFDYLLKRTVISTPTVLIDSSNIDEISFPNRRTGQDYALWLLLLKKVKFANCINENLVKVRKRNSSLSSNKLQNIIDVWEIQRDIININFINRVFNIIVYIIFTIKKRYF